MIHRILVALDGSSRAPGVLAAAAEVAARFDAVLVPFRAVSIPPEFPPSAHVPHGDPLPKYLEDTARAELAALATPLTVRRDPPVLGHGQPWRAILDAAREQGADLIVLGSHGYAGIDRVLGTTAARVVNLAARNVLVVHESHESDVGSPR